MDTQVLPDYLQLSDHQIAREKERQDRLRKSFNSRVRLSPAASEAARAQILEPSLRDAIKDAGSVDDLKQAKNRFAEAVAAQGRFKEAAEYTSDPVAEEFYRKAADTIFNGRECSCAGPLSSAGGRTVRLPKYRTIKEIYSLVLGQFAFLVECNKCQNWAVLGSDPAPTAAEPKPDAEVLGS